ncbi:membrane-targeted effector domain-containing toxin [Pseudomonas sp. App30]|uniref:dermonecrotic toxin domain-containing protein n=1 Tax=Pseudomonas sp. App30 TaxID=3068990 RepID=UPI003A7F93C0
MTHIPTAADRQALVDIAKRIADTMPDMRQKARDTANQVLHRHTGKYGEPDHIWWHRWKSGNTSHLTFTGWEHWGKPVQSLTLPQLVMHRYENWDQDNADLLHQWGGFYSQGPNERVYDEKNEIRLEPQDVLNDFWGLDFAGHYRADVDRFWASHEQDFRVMAKANFLAKALEEREARRISDPQFQTLVKAVAGDFSWPVSLAALQTEVPPARELKVYAFDIGGRIATDILRIVDQDGWQYLYTPGEVNCFHAFETDQDLYWWVLSQTNMAQNRARFMSHWPLSDNDGDNALHHSLDLLFYGWGKDHAKPINRFRVALQEDPFTFLTDTSRQRMYDDMGMLLHSNGDLRKQMWIGYLKAFGQAFGGLAALHWPIALAVVGAGIAEMGLHIDEAVNGHDTAHRKAAVIEAITSAVDVLFNATYLWSPAEEVITGELHPAQTHIGMQDIHPQLPAPYAAETAELLKPLETNEILGGGVGTEGKRRGIYRHADGKDYIELDGIGYQVRWANDLDRWAIVDPANPYSFYTSVPVQLNAQGEWQALQRLNLKGGGKFLGNLPWGNPVSRPTAPITPTFRYDMPEALRSLLQEGAEGLGDKKIRGYGDLNNPTELQAYGKFVAVRDGLNTDAIAFFQEFTLPARPTIPELDTVATQPTIIKGILANTDGLVIGESHSSVASKKFLIDNLPLLAKQGVRTLYMEHLLTDFHQAHLDTYARTGTMPEPLKHYLVDMDKGFYTDPSGRYTFRELVKAARRNHIRIQAIDCMASYRLAGLDDPTHTLRQQTMNYFAHTVMEADRNTLGAGKWVALMGNTHASTFKGVPGVAQLEGAMGLRIEDVPSNAARGIRVDTGMHASSSGFDGPGGLVKADLYYPMGTLRPGRDLELELSAPGMFTIDTPQVFKELIHRSGDGTLVYTELQKDGQLIYIERPRWPTVHNRRFDNTRELITALTMIGLKYVG